MFLEVLSGRVALCGVRAFAALDAQPIEDLETIIVEGELSGEPAVQMRDVVAAVEIVVDEDLPVALDLVGSTFEELKFIGVESFIEGSQLCRTPPLRNSTRSTGGSNERIAATIEAET